MSSFVIKCSKCNGIPVEVYRKDDILYCENCVDLTDTKILKDNVLQNIINNMTNKCKNEEDDIIIKYKKDIEDSANLLQNEIEDTILNVSKYYRHIEYRTILFTIQHTIDINKRIRIMLDLCIDFFQIEEYQHNLREKIQHLEEYYNKKLNIEDERKLDELKEFNLIKFKHYDSVSTYFTIC